MWKLPGCPMSFVTPDIWRLMRFAEFARKGAWPVVGGVLDQCHAFMEACEFIWSEEAHWRRVKKLGSPDG